MFGFFKRKKKQVEKQPVPSSYVPPSYSTMSPYHFPDAPAAPTKPAYFDCAPSSDSGSCDTSDGGGCDSGGGGCD